MRNEMKNGQKEIRTEEERNSFLGSIKYEPLMII